MKAARDAAVPSASSPPAEITDDGDARTTVEGRSPGEEAPGGVMSEGLRLIRSSQREWQWRGMGVAYCDVQPTEGGSDAPAEAAAAAAWGSSARPAVVLVHGFGASMGHWRNLVPHLSSAGYRVLALDLVGLGASDKPMTGVEYTIETWAELLGSFVSEVVQGPAVIAGNSIGSLVALAAAAALPPSSVSGLVLLNCAGGLNNKAIRDDWRIQLALPLFRLVDWLLGMPPVATAIFNRVKTSANVSAVLRSVYRNQAAVDGELVELILHPSSDPGALHVFVSVITEPPGPRPEQLLPSISAPLLLMWGDKDPFTPVDGPVGRFFANLPLERPHTSMVMLKDVGHCPQDDRPKLVHAALMPWLNGLAGEGV